MSSSNSCGLQNSASERNLQQISMEQWRKKRMISNRESARRSRMRKQKRLDDLAAQVSWLRKENNQILGGLHFATREYLNIDAHNAVLKAQAAELRYRLQSLNEILSFLCAGNGGGIPAQDEMAAGFVVGNYWNCLSQPVVMAAASAETLYPC